MEFYGMERQTHVMSACPLHVVVQRRKTGSDQAVAVYSIITFVFLFFLFFYVPYSQGKIIQLSGILLRLAS